MEVIFSLAPWQKIYFKVLLGSLIAITTAACFYWVYQTLQAYGVKAVSPNPRLPFAQGFFLLCILLDLFVWIYSKFFISKIAFNGEHKTLTFSLGIPGRPKLSVPVSEVNKLTFRDDYDSTIFNCYTVRIKGRLLPLVLSAWGVSQNERLLRKLFNKEDLEFKRNPWEGT